ncbi:hypothetical protein GCM10009133_35210 [Cocleimonas flava]|uniref:Methyltransferase family protein n=1 Tax=Cocleimonas flava TaxID=634765 RepID=A0A4R1F350_9GAMM|nr:class I SAM-dependent methyltransferase [Cocleimonas flava]TCJ88637.1 methyltransferase family protein [Cocleimonas flava]
MKDNSYIAGNKIPAQAKHKEKTEYNDFKIKYYMDRCKDKKVLDIGCVQHNQDNWKSKFWLHKAIKEVASEIQGIDIFQEGINNLKERGYTVTCADAQDFDLEEKFDVIVAGDIIEHLDNVGGFVSSCKRHMHKDSHLLISTPNIFSARKLFKFLTSKNGEINVNPEHVHWYCPTTIRQLMQRHDLKLSSITYGSRTFDRYIPLPKKIRHSTCFYDIEFFE